MSLYRMEVCKLCRKKYLWVIGALMIAWLAFYFYAEVVGAERSSLEGVTYYGYDAIRIDREITREYEGILTDKDVNEIADRYGLPAEVERYVGWKKVNYLTEFITDQLSDGYIQEWDDYQPPEHIVPLADSRLKDYIDDGRNGIPFGYMKGWKKFYDFFDTGVEMLLIWLIIALAPVFCEEKQQKVHPLIFTSEYGKSKDVRARIMAAVSIAVILYLALLAVSLLLFQSVFGIWDVALPAGLALNYNSPWFLGITGKSCTTFLAISGFQYLTAVVMTAAVSIWVSSVVKTVFSSLLISLLIFCVPVVLQITAGNALIYFFASGQPFFMANHNCLIETFGVFGFHMVFAWAAVAAGIICGARAYRT